MAKRRSNSAASPTHQPAQARRAKKKPTAQQSKPSGATGTESLREEAERGWAKLDRQIARRQKRDLARTIQRVKSKTTRVGEST